MQFNVLDYIIIAVLILSALAGLRRGFFNVASGLMGTLIGLSGAIIFYRELAQYLENYFGVSIWLTSVLREHWPLPVLQPGIYEALGYSAGLSDPLSYLVTAFIKALSFLLIFLLGSKIIQLLCRLLDVLLGHGILSDVNHSLGAGLLLLKNLIIIAVLAGVILSPLEIGARMGMPHAVVTTRYMHDSILLEQLLKLFAYLKVFITV
jgi:uncharacterized membrane protein required for colicin V production